MEPVRMTRSEVRKAIASSVEDARSTARSHGHEDLTRTEQLALLAVGEMMPHIAYGTWQYSNAVECGCPAVEAGLCCSDGSGRKPVVDRFAQAFDDHIIMFLRQWMTGDTVVPRNGVIMVTEREDFPSVLTPTED